MRHIQFSRSDVERMLDVGLLNDRRFELIEGALIDKSGQNPPHAGVIQFLLEWFVHLFGARRVRVLLSLEVSRADGDRNMPEPDLAIVEAKAEYRRRHPRGNETLLIVEVADTSLRQDLIVKRDLYARAGVPEYWVASIPSRELILHRGLRQGSYQQVTTLSDGEMVSAACMPEELVPVSLIFGDEE